MEPRLAAILVADMAGYARLTEACEFDTHRRLMGLRSGIIGPALAQWRGRVVKQTGDGFISTFGSVNDAVCCAIQIQRDVQSEECNVPTERKIRFRMGLNVGDVFEEEGDTHGAGVNVAARLQELAEPAGLLISGVARHQVGYNLTLPVVDLGLVTLKNLQVPVHVFRVVTSTEHVLPRLDAGSLHRRPSIAVLPFRTLHSDQRQAWFGEGIVEEIIGALASLKDFFVISRSSTMAYRGQEVDVRHVGAELGVRYVLSGSVRRSARYLRISAELAEAEDRAVLWAQTFDSGLGDLFRIQDEITARIVCKVAPRIHEAEIQRAFLKRPDNMDAYDHFLQAFALLYRLREPDFAQAGTLLRRAIALDDSYATSFALAAEWHGLRVGQGWSPDPKVDSEEVLRLAEAALDRDPTNVRALALLGHYRSYFLRDFDGALDLFDRALSASPSSAWAWGRSAPTFSYIGDGDEAIRRVQQALSLSPSDPLSHRYHTSLCIGYYTRGDYEQAVCWGRFAMRENPRYTAALYPTAAALGALGRRDEAREVASQILRFNPLFRAAVHASRYPYRDESRRRQLEQHLLAAGLPP